MCVRNKWAWAMLVFRVGSGELGPLVSNRLNPISSVTLAHLGAAGGDEGRYRDNHKHVTKKALLFAFILERAKLMVGVKQGR